MSGLSSPVAGIAIAVLTSIAFQATAQNYNYTAKTERTVLKAGTVMASGLNWSCQGTACTISGPWPQPGLSACQSLAGQVGKIVEYGHPGAKLTVSQLDQCNSNALKGNTYQKASPAIIDTSKVKLPNPIKTKPGINPTVFDRKPVLPDPTPTSTPTSTPTPFPSGPDVLIQEGSYQDYTLYVKAVESMEFHGAYSGAHPSLSSDVISVRWSGTTLRLPAFTHTGADVSEEAAILFGTSSPDGVYSTDASGYFIEIPVRMSGIPQRIASVTPACTLSAVTDGTASLYPAYTHEHQIGFGEASFHRRNVVDGDWSIDTTVRLPVILRPMMEIGDIHSVSCQVNLKVTRLTGSGVDHITMERAIDPSDPSFVAGFASEPGSVTFVRAKAVVEE